MNKELGIFELPKDEKALMEVVERGQQVKGFVIYCQLITEEIDDHAFCEKCPFHIVHMKTRIPIICTSAKRFTYTKKGEQIMLNAEGVETVEFPMTIAGAEEGIVLKVTQSEKKVKNLEDKEQSINIFAEILEKIKQGNIHHRRCDVCGCELAVPDAGAFSRSFFTTMACTGCSYTKQHSDLLGYVEELKKQNRDDKATVHRILDERMMETWGNGSIYTIEDWERYRGGP